MIDCFCLNRHSDESAEEYAARRTRFDLPAPRELRTVEHSQHHAICGIDCHAFRCPIYLHGLQRMTEGK